MRVAILGSGPVGQRLGAGFASRGHAVMIGSRSPDGEKLRDWVAGTEGDVSTGTFAEAAQFGETAVLATLWSGTHEALRLAGPERLAGKVVIDATNPLRFEE